MKQMIDRCSTKFGVHIAYAFALFTLLFPPHVLAELPGATTPQEASDSTSDLPAYFIIDRPDDGLSYELTRQGNGDYLMESTDRSQSLVVDAATISQTTVEVLTGDDLGGPFSATLTVPDNVGGFINYGFYGDWDPISETATGMLVLPDNTEKRLNMSLPSSGGLALKEVIIITIVVSAAAIGAIGCTILGWVTNCIDDCADACGDLGVRSATEGACGSCTCECFPPPPPPPCDRDGDTRGNFTNGNKNIDVYCPAPLPDPQQF